MNHLVDSLQSPLFRKALLEALITGLVSGVVGVHVILRRLPFFVTAMSHATFPGVVIASMLGISLFLGGTVFGLVVVAAVLLGGGGRVLDDASVIGVVLAGSFALGMLILSTRPGSSKDLAAFLVGSVLTVTNADIVTTIAVGVVVIGVLAVVHKEIVMGAFDRNGVAALGYRPLLLDAVVLVAVTAALVSAIPAVGALLAIAMLTVPALTARLWSDRMVPTMALAGAIGVLSALLGLCAAALWGVAAGGAIALAAGACFMVSLATTEIRRSLRLRRGSRCIAR